MTSLIVYPSVYRDEDKSDDYHGEVVKTPYHWLESAQSEETKKFVDEQNKISEAYLADCDLGDKFSKRLEELWNFPKVGCPFKEGKRYFYFYNSGLQNQSVLYGQLSLDSEAFVFLDPNKLSEDGTVALRGYSFSEDGELFAYGLSKSGSDWTTIHFMEVETLKVLPDVLERVKFSCMSWMHDGKGLFYNRYPDQDYTADGTDTDANVDQKLYYHSIGSNQSDDILCAEFPDHPKWMIGAEVSDDGKYLLVCPREGCDPVNRLYYVDISELNYKIEGLLSLKKIVDNFDAEYEYITNESTVFTLKTNLNAPRYKLINIDFADPNLEVKTLIDERKTDVLDWASCVNQNNLFLCYNHHVKNEIFLCNLNDGSVIKQFQIDVGSVVGFSGDKKLSEIFYQFTSFLTPGVIYHCDLSSTDKSVKVFKEIEVKGFQSSLYETTQIFYPSKDGTKIPMFVVHKKGIVLDGTHPCLLYGYGGFNISIMPSFSVSRIAFMQHLQGIHVIANIRGGGEYGEEWHKGGTMQNKQNVFDDFHCAAEYLISSGYTSSSKIAINGGSNGGLLVGTCANQRPDLYKCAVAQVGVFDMLKFHKFTIGHAWTTDFGCADKKVDYQWLKRYSPLHNVTIPDGDKQYPATLLLTADHDDRVVPLHSYKFIAALQHIIGQSKKQTNPLIIRVDTKSGHGAGKPTKKRIEEISLMYGFIARNVNASWQE